MAGARGMAVVALGLAIGLGARPAPAQRPMINVTTPFRTQNESFFENMGTSWGVRGPNFFFNFGGGQAAPPFGNAQPNAGLQGGVGLGGGGWSGNFNFFAGQGSQRSNVMQAPTMTLMNGVPGVFSDTSQTPFVMGQIPIVGGAPFGPVPRLAPPAAPPWRQRLDQLGTERPGAGEPSPAGPRGQAAVHADLPAQEGAAGPLAAQLRDAQSAAAGAGPLSVRELTAARAAGDAARRQEAWTLIEKAEAARAAGKDGVARVYYQQALKRADDSQRAEIASRLQSLGK